MNPIYLDYAATTFTDKDVAQIYLKHSVDAFYNPASAHILGQRAAAALEDARLRCARCLDCEPRGVYFTSGGTESINWALKCAPLESKRIAVSAIEHDAVISCAQSLADRGYIVDYIKPNADGVITAEEAERVVTEDTALVCVMTVNNITGVIQPVKELAEAAHRKGALFFTDAVQAVNCLDLSVSNSGADMLCLSGHKFYAPKGVGLLYVNPRVKIKPFIEGGEQERGLRAGTVDVPAVAAMAYALEKAVNARDEYTACAQNVCDVFLSNLDCGKPIALNSPRIPDIVSAAFDGVNGNRLAIALSMAGVCCSVGSACSAGSQTPPRTLAEMGVGNADCAVRFSFGRGVDADTAVRAAHIVNDTVKKLRG